MHNSLHVSTSDPSETSHWLLHRIQDVAEGCRRLALTSRTRVRGLRGEQVRLHEMVSDQKAAGPSDSRFSKNPEITTEATCASHDWNSDVTLWLKRNSRAALHLLGPRVSMAISLWEESQKLIPSNWARVHPHILTTDLWVRSPVTGIWSEQSSPQRRHSKPQPTMQVPGSCACDFSPGQR